MARDNAPRQAGPAALSALFDDALKHLRGTQPAAPAGDGFLFSGNRHESVPRALFLDRRLTPLERNAWQVFRLQLNDDGVTAFPTYDQLRPYLASMPCAAQASHETVARALTLLRLTRWLSLVRRRRDPKTGRILGNLYVLHDEPLTPFEAIQLDPDYLGLVSQALTHAARSVQIVGLHTLQEIAGDPHLTGHALPTRMQVLAQRLARHGWTESYPQGDAGHDSEAGADGLLRNGERPSSESEPGPEPAPDASLRNPKEDRTVRSSRREEVRTVPHAQAPEPRLRLPQCFLALKEEQQTGALIALRKVEADQQQAVLDEWAARCRSSAVRNPAAYLFGIIQKAMRGEFRASAGQPESAPVPPQPPPLPRPPPPPPHQPACRETVQTHLARLRSILRRP